MTAFFKVLHDRFKYLPNLKRENFQKEKQGSPKIHFKIRRQILYLNLLFSLDARLAIAITANFVNRWSSEEAAVEEIGGLSRFILSVFTSFKNNLEPCSVQKDNIYLFVLNLNLKKKTNLEKRK